MVTAMTLETMYIIQSCSCSNGNCHASGAASNALISPEIPIVDAETKPPEISIDPNMPYAERIRTQFASFPPARFSAFCPSEAHTFQLKGNSGVSWLSRNAKGPGYQHRGKSIHCLLARAVARHPEWQSMTLRITLGDSDTNQAYTLAPSSTKQTHAFLFPDFTWESWPEIDDATPQVLMAQRVLGNATLRGLPGTPEWKQRRYTRAMWRGNNHVLRKDFVTLTQNLTHVFDVQTLTTYGNSEGPIPHYISREDHCRYQFLVHLNGAKADRYSSALKWRFLCGALVFVQTEPLFYEWWNLGMQPFVHFVPFSSPDELATRIREYTTNLDEAAKIAKAGHELAKRAFEHMNDYVDEFLVQYENLTAGIPQRTCRSKGPIQAAPSEFQTLDQLKAEYGPTVCK